MTHATYDSYKESGIPWLGKVPAGWEVVRLKNCAEVRSSNVDKKTNEGEIPVKLCNYVDVYYNDKITDEIKFMSATASQNEIARFTLKAGDVVITKDSESANDIGVPTLITDKVSNIVCGYHLAIIKRHEDFACGAYLFYLIKSEPSARQFEVMSNGVTRFGLPYGAIKNLNITLPPLTEQKAIAEFLDTKTAQIDALIAKKKNLLKLLAEQRTALITNAVTRGLDKSAPMKESGITWLGKVPNHWEVARLKTTCAYTKNGVWGADADGEDDIPCIRVADFNREKFSVSDKKLTLRAVNSSERIGRILEIGDLLLEKSGGGDKQLVGAVVIYRLPFPAVCSNFVAKIKVASGHEPQFITYLHAHLYAGKVNYRSIKQTTGIQNLDSESYFNEKVPIPPLAEQKAIADFLDCKTAEIDATKDRITTAIDTLKEYRTALITNAVTGKIKVI